MAPSEHDDDYYVVLEVTNNASLEKLRKNYYKLAKTRHPDKGGSNEAFQLLLKAYETLVDPTKRRAYNTIWPGIRDRLRAQQESAKQQAEAAKVERQREAELRAKKEKIYEALERQNAKARAKDKRERQNRLQTLRATKARYDREIRDLLQDISMHEFDLKHLEEQDKEDLRLDKEQTSSKDANEQKQARDYNRLQRVASRRLRKKCFG
ncbi:DnaJ domain-containing protein [Usnea florida]